MIADHLVSFYLKICYSGYYYLLVSLNLYFIQQHSYFKIIFLYGLFIHNFSIINQLYQDVSFHQQINDFIDFIILSELEQVVVNFLYGQVHFSLHLKVETSYLMENCNYFITKSNILKKHRLQHLFMPTEQHLSSQEQTYYLIWKCSFMNFFAFAKFKSCYTKQNHRFGHQKRLQTCEYLDRFWLFKDDITQVQDHEL